MVRVLVVEDDEENMEAIRDLLKLVDYDVLEARNGRIGVEMAGAEKPDVILMDMRMPELDGYEATRQLKGAAETKAIPIIALTGEAMEEQRRQAMDAGCDDFVSKPVDFDQLLDRITAALGANNAVQ